MRAKGAILRELNKPFLIEELEWDDPRDDEIGVRIVATGVCHSDWHCTDGSYTMDFPDHPMLARPRRCRYCGKSRKECYQE